MNILKFNYENGPASLKIKTSEYSTHSKVLIMKHYIFRNKLAYDQYPVF